MTLSRRLWLWGAVLPACILGAVLTVADAAFCAALERTLDQALLAQAAIESVSLFDGPKNEPHLHMASSPLVDSVRPFAPEGILFGPDGQEVMRYPPSVLGEAHPKLIPSQLSSSPALHTVEHDGHRHRELIVSVSRPGDEKYALKLSASLAQLDTSARNFHLAAVATTLATAIVLLLVQGLQGRRLRQRLSGLRAQLEAVRADELERRLEPDHEGDELTEVHEVLGQATERLRAVRDSRERLLADAAHELRTPLALMRTRLDLALRRERPTAELRVAIEETRAEVIRLAELASRLLDTAAINQSVQHLEDVEVLPLVESAVAAVRDAANGRNIGLEVRVDSALSLHANAQALRQALDNLLSNALKFAPEGTLVIVSATARDGSLFLSVKDSGPGVPESEREAVFEPFHRVRGGPPGTGLGLTIVREIARRHQGQAYVAPTSTGAEVVVSIPLGAGRDDSKRLP